MSLDASIKAVIDAQAAAHGVPAALAEAIALVESGGNPSSIGDGGASVGLYQLNAYGEGAGMSVAQRSDPNLNASIALTQIGSVYRSNPGGDPGAIAAAAQRPADRAGYAAKVDAQLAQLGAGSGSDPSAGPTLAGFTQDSGSGFDPKSIGNTAGAAAVNGLSGALGHLTGWASGRVIALLTAAVLLYIAYSPTWTNGPKSAA